jgi:hypothetical protein
MTREVKGFQIRYLKGIKTKGILVGRRAGYYVLGRRAGYYVFLTSKPHPHHGKETHDYGPFPTQAVAEKWARKLTATTSWDRGAYWRDVAKTRKAQEAKKKDDWS